jgi:predicted PurR-regulated permease PerM
MALPRSNRTLIFLLGIVAAILMGWVLHVGAGILQPLVIALLLAILLQPIVRFLAKVGIPPVLTVVFLVVLLFFGFVRLGMYIQTSLEQLMTTRPASAMVDGQPGSGGGPEVGPPPPPEASEDDAAPAEGQEQLAAATPEETAEPGPAEEPASDETELAQAGGEGDAEQAPATGDEEGAEAQPDEEEEGAAEPPFDWQSLSLERQERISSEVGGWEGLVEGIVERIQGSSMPPRVKDYLARSIREIEPEQVAPDLVGSSFSFSKGLLLVLLYMLFIFAEQAVFRRKILSIAGTRRDDAVEILDTIGRGIQRYLGVKTIVSLATGSLCYAALVILRVPYAPLWGFLTFVLNYIPTFGSIIAAAFPVLTVLATPGGSIGKAAVVVIIYLGVNITLGSILEPRILGRELNLSPLVVVLSVVVWAGLWGVIGGFLAVPLTSILQIVLASQETTRPIAVMLSSGKGLESEPPPAAPPAGFPQAVAERREKTA